MKLVVCWLLCVLLASFTAYLLSGGAPTVSRLGMILIGVLAGLAAFGVRQVLD